MSRRLTPTGSALSYLTFLGSEVNTNLMSPIATVGNVLYSIAVDAAGNAYLGGATSDPRFPTSAGSFLPGFNIPQLGLGLPPVVYEGFLAKLKPDASGMVWATYLDRGNAAGTSTFVKVRIAPDPLRATSGPTGITGGIVFPSTIGASTGPEFVVALNSTGSGLNYQLNEPMGTIGQSLALDPAGFVHLAGINGFVSAIPPATPLSMKISYVQNAAGTTATARIAPAEVIAIFGPGIGPMVPATATPTNGFYPKTLGGVQVTINGMNMPLLYVSRNQINAVVPMGIPINSSAFVRVTTAIGISPDFPVWIVPSAPQSH